MTTPSAVVIRRALVVDDSADLAESMAAALSLLGFEAQTAHNGPDALVCMASWRPEVVFLDLTMPDTGGIEVVQSARSSEWSRGMIIIAMTGWSAQSQRDSALAAGFDQFVEKPFDLAILRALLAPFEARSANAETDP
jgi:two-component system OmpR family response regulator